MRENYGAIFGEMRIAASVITVNVSIDQKIDWSTAAFLKNVGEKRCSERVNAVVDHRDMIFADEYGHIATAKTVSALNHNNAGHDFG